MILVYKVDGEGWGDSFMGKVWGFEFELYWGSGICLLFKCVYVEMEEDVGEFLEIGNLISLGGIVVNSKDFVNVKIYI